VDPTDTVTQTSSPKICGTCCFELGDHDAGIVNTSSGEYTCDRCYEVERLDRELAKLREFNAALARAFLRFALEEPSRRAAALASETAEILDGFEAAA
jgi:hypothetical protein